MTTYILPPETACVMIEKWFSENPVTSTEIDQTFNMFTVKNTVFDTTHIKSLKGLQSDDTVHLNLNLRSPCHEALACWVAIIERIIDTISQSSFYVIHKEN